MPAARLLEADGRKPGAEPLCSGNGLNQSYRDAYVALQLGASQSLPFSGTAFTPRVWNGTIHYELACAGSATLAGSGCRDSGGVRNAIAIRGCPDLGAPFGIDLLAGTGGPAVLLAGVSSTTWLGLPLPLDLTPLGAAGCSVYVSHDVNAGTRTFTAGRAAFDITVPNDPLLAGAALFFQGYHGDPAANALGLVATDCAEVIVR